MKSLKSDKTLIMGVLNVTPDSFSDGGKFLDKNSAVARALEMESEGADIIDIGGESTRPGAGTVPADEEIGRVVPVIERLRGRMKARISVDTRKSEVAEAALKAGASIVNDVSGLHHDRTIAKVAAKHGACMILMHMRGTPENMQVSPRYSDLMGEISKSLKCSADEAVRAGVAKDRIAVDPGIGFGKTVEHNLEILNRLDEFVLLGYPVCVGTSRKSFLGKILGRPDAGDRLAGTIATCVLAVLKGAHILRVHDVREAREAVTVIEKIWRSSAST
jgi:dihydropteroate synthase